MLYKRFLTPFPDGVRNRRQVSDGDRGSFPHDQKPSGICPPGTHARQNEVVCDRRALKYGNTYSRAKNTIAPRKTFPFTGTSHTIFPVKSFAFLNVSHTVRRRNCVAKVVHHTQFYVVNVCVRWPNANSFQEKVVCDCSLIQHGLLS